MPQVYAVVHDGAGKFLIAQKNCRGYFFHSSSRSGGSVIRWGQPLNAGGLPALPGGRLEASNPAAGAAQELLEETGTDIGEVEGFAVSPATFQDRERFARYFGVYFQVTPEALFLLPDVINARLGRAKLAAEKVRTTPDLSYAALMVEFPESPADNELEQVSVWDLMNEADWAIISSWKDDPEIGWYYPILANLKAKLSGKDLAGVSPTPRHRPKRLVSRFARRRR
ncbi:MAG TPA: NUDIX domain-containing protein [Thermoanaerobaculia bacterium]|nr:NUDIX domain-containing protein [Thermoanaerobaculia bacterium]